MSIEKIKKIAEQMPDSPEKQAALQAYSNLKLFETMADCFESLTERSNSMGAYICDVCDNMFCSHEVNYMYCETCKKAFCEDCWIERLHEDQDLTEYDTCGDCYAKSIEGVEKCNAAKDTKK